MLPQPDAGLPRRIYSLLEDGVMLWGLAFGQRVLSGDLKREFQRMRLTVWCHYRRYQRGGDRRRRRRR
jgi:hypothetical protein